MARSTRMSIHLIAAAALILLLATGAATAKKHKPLKVTCDQLHAQIFKTAEQFRSQYNAMGFTIEDAPEGFLVGGGCKKFGKRTRQGSAYMADVHHSGDNDPPFPGEANPDVLEYHWLWNETVTVTKKRKLVSTVSDFRCVKDVFTQLDIQEVPC
jgi:hypothetical protein